MTQRDPEKYKFYLLPRKTDEFTLYTTRDCPYCKASLTILNSLKNKKTGSIIKYINYDYNAVFADGITSLELAKLTDNYKYIPIIFHYDKFVGGYDALIALLRREYNYKPIKGLPVATECAKIVVSRKNKSNSANNKK